MFGSYDPGLKPGGRVKPIADPYYGGSSGFDDCYEQCTRYAEGFLDHLEQKLEQGK
jgi:low molecular weight phosphotyrosine protein phosphatase